MGAFDEELKNNKCTLFLEYILYYLLIIREKQLGLDSLELRLLRPEQEVTVENSNVAVVAAAGRVMADVKH